MGDEVAPIYWYLLWAVVLTVLPIVMIVLEYRRRVKGLEILRIYAERQVDPPADVIELVAKEIDKASSRAAKTMSSRDARFGGFIGFTFVACVLGAVAWWRIDAGGPQLLTYALVGAGSFFGIGALGFLAFALLTRDK